MLDRKRLEEIDPDLYSVALSCLHQMAASDPDLEIRMLARVVLGTMDRIKNEVDLAFRIVQYQDPPTPPSDSDSRKMST